ncbi:MAG: polysaccharide biosynthesis C-terminal domain-containing protein [Xanthomonadaceae bacterium]|nr:polysaccharide biosynthesis C-terminal domain-containing protein [Xanthomonadaceae bacterium]
MRTLVVYGVRLIIQIALLFGLARWLGPTEFGEFAGVAALAMGLGTLSGFGLGFVVLAESAKSADAGQATLEQAVPATLLSAALLMPIYFWLAMGVLDSNAGLVGLVLIGLSELLLVPLLGLIGHRLHGLGFVASSQAVVLWPMALRLAGLIVCIMLEPARTLDVYALVHGLGALFALALGWTLAGAKAVLPNRLRRPDWATLRQGARYALMNLAAMSPGELDKALALRLIGSTGTGVYALASRSMVVVTLPVSAMLQAALPRLIQGLHEPDRTHRQLLGLVLSLSGMYGMASALLLHWAAPPLLEILFGEAYEGIGSVVANIAWIAPFMSLRIATGATLFALGRPLLRSSIEGSALAILVALALILTPRFGIDGIVWAVLISEAAMAAFGFVALTMCLRRISPSLASPPLM